MSKVADPFSLISIALPVGNQWQTQNFVSHGSARPAIRTCALHLENYVFSFYFLLRRLQRRTHAVWL